ncbi:glycosyltransferase [Clostridium grantii]|uniref:Glycosyltransferase involved in cell wall bisynthesis n=1 Tax=Clostridium grantii DSM 8605 TaxID=1121316 RepID=A0A1M5UZE1_9CLOT|nr:glycosyltransferase [Clostridium grantii]SHH68296.1 Glycosyltransferase involved in cell wall bisynthesis [Clostridium grantii DSM 8605]
MKKKIFISMYSLNIGGVERSLIGLLETIDYSKYDIDLFLYRHEGEFMEFIPKEVNLLSQIPQYSTFERPIKNVIKEGHVLLGFARILAKVRSKIKSKGLINEEGTYKYMQYIWRYSIPFLPTLKKQYNLAIGFLGPYDFLINKVKAEVKMGWVHTDYYTIVNPDKKIDRKMWNKLDYIVNVSEACEKSFLKVFPEFRHKTIVIENILSTNFIKQQAKIEVCDELYDNCKVKVCSVGRLSHQKGFDMAVQACKLLVDKGYNIKWYIVGHGCEEGKIKSLIKQYSMENEFILLGKKVNPYPYIKKCDIYCQPSRYEGKAVTVREAQILNKPVVISNFPTAKSQLENRVDGYITELSIEGIADGIEKLYQDEHLRYELSENCKKHDYSNKNELEKIYDIL